MKVPLMFWLQYVLIMYKATLSVTIGFGNVSQSLLLKVISSYS